MISKNDASNKILTGLAQAVTMAELLSENVALLNRIEQLEAALQKMNDYPMAYDARQILITALEGKTVE